MQFPGKVAAAGEIGIPSPPASSSLSFHKVFRSEGSDPTIQFHSSSFHSVFLVAAVDIVAGCRVFFFFFSLFYNKLPLISLCVSGFNVFIFYLVP